MRKLVVLAVCALALSCGGGGGGDSGIGTLTIFNSGNCTSQDWEVTLQGAASPTFALRTAACEVQDLRLEEGIYIVSAKAPDGPCARGAGFSETVAVTAGKRSESSIKCGGCADCPT